MKFIIEYERDIMEKATATKSNKKEMPPRFWYLQMLRKQTDSLTKTLFLLQKDGVNVDKELGDVLEAFRTAAEKVTAKFPDPRKS